MEKLYCEITGKESMNMKLRIFLRLLFLLLLFAVYSLKGIDGVIILVSVFVVSDLDSIADSLGRRKDK